MFREGDPPEDRWFSATARDAAYLVWDVGEPEAALSALGDVGLDVRILERT
jgi:hypothetical protein